MRELRKLRLPQLVEAKKQEERIVKVDTAASRTMGHLVQLSQSSISSDYPSPTTPTFSTRGHSRFPSSTSSLASSPVLRDSIDAFGVSKRPLTEVREEPHEPDEDHEMNNTFTNSPPDQDGMSAAYAHGRIGLLLWLPPFIHS